VMMMIISGPCIVIYLRNKDQQDALFFLHLFKKIYPPHVSNRVTIHHQEAVTVYTAYGIYRASAVSGC
jgi:hypothetical protein